jgi:hypothetical protein
MKIFNFFISNFRGAFQFFQFPLVVWLDFFSNFKIDFCQKFPFPSGGMAICFFKIQKQKFLIQISKPKILISNFPCGINEFFLGLRLSNLLKDCKNYLVILMKNSHILENLAALPRVASGETIFLLILTSI